MPVEPLRIAHLVTSLEPGGMENGVVNIANSLLPDFESHVFCLERAGAFANRLDGDGRVTLLGKTSGFSPVAVWNLKRHLRRLNPALLHTHNLGPLIYGSLATSFGRATPILHGEHSQLSPAEKAGKRLLQRRLLYACCRRVHAVSSSLRSELIAAGLPGGKIEVIVNGVDTVRFHPGEKESARQQIGLPGDAVVAGIVGRFGPYKGHVRLIEAFERLAGREPRAWLLIVGGGGSESEAVAARVRSSPHAARIRLAGFQPEPCPYYQAMDFLVIPSANEGMSNAALEAMACGVPVLAGEACGNADVITPGKDGWLADLSDADRIADKLFDVLREGGRLMEMSRCARETALLKFSLRAMTAAYAQLYRQVAASQS